MLELNRLYHMDCMDGMKQIPDKYFELAICDPPSQDFSLAMCEFAWCSIQRPAKIFRLSVLSEKGKIHPTQKPVALYKWLLKNYAKPGDKILDTHVGSASSLIACEDMGFEYVGFELDADYHAAATKRLNDFKAQTRLPLEGIC